MARDTYEDWIPVETGGAVITRVQQVSAVESLARPETMATSTKHVPRSSGVAVATVAKGGAYGEDSATNDDVLLTARKFGRAIRIADEDIQDIGSVADVVAVKMQDWATSYGKFMDNAALGVTAAENGTTIPFTSVYKAITTSNSDTSYTANANLVQTGGALTYDDLSDTLALVEDSDYFDEINTVIIASPAFKGLVRGIVNSNGDPIFVEQAQWPNGGAGSTLLGHPVRWSVGCRTSETATATPAAGNPLLVVCNRDFLILGKRSGPEYRYAGADTGAAFLTDEDLLKMRARRGFAVGHEKAFAVLEVTAAGS